MTRPALRIVSDKPKPKSLESTPLSQRWVEVPAEARCAAEELRQVTARLSTDLGRATTPAGKEAALVRLVRAEELVKRLREALK